MPVQIEYNNTPNIIKVDDIMEGEAYICHEHPGEIFIGNFYGGVVAFSISGKSVILSGEDNFNFEKVNALIKISK